MGKSELGRFNYRDQTTGLKICMPQSSSHVTGRYMGDYLLKNTILDLLRLRLLNMTEVDTGTPTFVIHVSIEISISEQFTLLLIDAWN